MAAKKVKKQAKKPAKKAAKTAAKAAAKKTRTRSASNGGNTQTQVQDTRSAATPSATTAATGQKIRIRMFRVGFGDFFLLTLFTADGEKHILIDCGVHARDLKSIRDAVTQMAKDCGSHLSLVIMTHRHADHISGFGSCSDLFAQITVDRVWMPWFEDPTNAQAKSLQSSLTALARQLSIGLAARGDADSPELSMVRNITGNIDFTGTSANQKALDVLNKGFKNPTQHDYYKAGDTPKFPPDLVSAGLTAEILGPPIDASLVAQMTNKAQQYLAGDGGPDEGTVLLFSEPFWVEPEEYPASAFALFDRRAFTKLIDGAQPDALAARAATADKTLNNQSLVILFSFAGKNLLFAGDAQWGNWENFLYGGAYGTPGHTKLTPKASDLLSKIDFYKVGHHGSANATPKDAVDAMRLGCVGMCSTQVGAYNEVPREPLLAALRGRMSGKLARSDQVAATASVQANPQAGPLPAGFTSPGTLYIDFNL